MTYDKEEVIANIKKAIENGADSIQAISKVTGYSHVAIIKYFPECPRGSSKAKNRDEVITDIKKAIENGANSICAISKVTGHSYFIIIKYFPECPKGKKWRKGERKKFLNLSQHPKGTIIAEGIEKGLTLEEIATNASLTRERIRQIIKFCGEYEYWKLYRFASKKIPYIRTNIRKTVLSQIGNCFDTFASTLENDSSWAEARAAEYFYGKRKCHHNDVPLEKIIKALEKYKEGIDNGIRYSYKEMGDYAGIHLTVVYKILRKLNLKSLYWNSKMPTKKQKMKKREAINRAKEKLGFASISDISYFLKVSEPMVKRILEKKQPNPFIMRFKDSFALTYKIASQIYEAQDLGFNDEETASLVSTKDVVVTYANKYRQDIEQRIIKILDVLYPSEIHTKPYRN